MSIVSMKEMLQHALQHGYAVGQYNMNSVQWVQATLRAAQEEQGPVIVAASDRLVDYLGGFRLITESVKALVEEMEITVPVALHLDHGKTVERCLQAIDAGFTSVMYDGSHTPIQQNIEDTKRVVEAASKYGVSVEAEVGSVGGVEDGLVGGIIYADPEECRLLAEKTGIDALAAALGSVHGVYQGEPKLGFKEMEEIQAITGIPLVLHGGSGIPLAQIQRAIKLGHAKINVNTECLQAWTQAVRHAARQESNAYDAKELLIPGMEAVTDTVKRKMKDFGTSARTTVAGSML
ncbi:class II fructose-1,6-bisphosphate aldolase [Terribacillus saccharophilus]|uniref:class II fructose-1,6-bisphosphate aldolase n=1 Tax=Terribacillus saccharophilus TaxID=361277 RepID=UPI003982C0A2